MAIGLALVAHSEARALTELLDALRQLDARGSDALTQRQVKRSTVTCTHMEYEEGLISTSMDGCWEYRCNADGRVSLRPLCDQRDPVPDVPGIPSTSGKK